MTIEPLTVDEMKQLLGDKELTIFQLSRHIQKLDEELKTLRQLESTEEIAAS